ncbi:Alpha/beta hydrolase fold-1 [Leptodontidium sp. 2 PMI_412]|nr:Alpha/beta hydrolase fold-1 [Leptodontidium sp. 2 PMI_412]
MSARPTLIFLPGAWHSPSVYDAVISKLTTYGYSCQALPLQAIVGRPAVTSLQPDIDALNTTVLAQVEAGKDVIVVGHSWSGMIVGGALEGLSKTAREKEGKHGGVVKLAYIAAFVPLEGVSLIQTFGGGIPDFFDVKEPWVSALTPIPLFYHDLPKAEADSWAAKLEPHSYATKFLGTERCSWREIPSSYLLCEDDKAIPPQVQEAMVEACKKEGAKMEIVRVMSGHSPFLSKVEETVQWLRGVAGEDV